MKFIKIFKFGINLLLAVVCSIIFTGCLGETLGTSPQDESSPAGRISAKTPTAVYYDFEDVLIPLELQVDKKRTVIVSSPGFVSGILALKGRVDRESIYNFFSINMQKDNWEVISQIKSHETIIMVFQKALRTAVITIRDAQIYTYVEVGVAPTVNEAITNSQPLMSDPSVSEPVMSEPGMTETILTE